VRPLVDVQVVPYTVTSSVTLYKLEQ
jgi:hypothetical protein